MSTQIWSSKIGPHPICHKEFKETRLAAYFGPVHKILLQNKINVINKNSRIHWHKCKFYSNIPEAK